MCAKLRTVAASNNRDHPTRSLYYCLFTSHVYVTAHSTQRHRRGCNTAKAFNQKVWFVFSNSEAEHLLNRMIGLRNTIRVNLQDTLAKRSSACTTDPTTTTTTGRRMRFPPGSLQNDLVADLFSPRDVATTAEASNVKTV